LLSPHQQIALRESWLEVDSKISRTLLDSLAEEELTLEHWRGMKGWTGILEDAAGKQLPLKSCCTVVQHVAAGELGDDGMIGGLC
jgi:hypothetical protein